MKMSIVSLEGSCKLRVKSPKLHGFTVIALDLGTHCGWAIADCGIIESGVQMFDLKRGESPGMRFVRFNKWLSDLVYDLNADIVVYEMAHHRGGYATELLVGLATRVQEICANRNIPYNSVHSSTMKKRATGSGKASKEDMIKSASEFIKKPVVDDNEADAICLLKIALEDYVT
jgi:Holliday junction resolvasome RuvABC endonuclease subunit